MKKTQTLFWRISAILVLLMVVVGIAYIWLIAYTAKLYFQEANQRLNAGIAQHIVNERPPFDSTGKVNKASLEDLFSHTMTLNPAIEIYLLDPAGNILTYFAPHKKIKLKVISLEPINEFIKTKGQQCVMGDDPRNPGTIKVFSSAAILQKGELKGYIYVVLASEEYDSITNLLLGTYLMRVGTISMLLTLFVSLCVALLAIWLITRNLQKITETVKTFQEGNLESRVQLKTQGEFKILGDAFNEMADKIVLNINQLQMNENLRRELIANVSHDLRTPLAVIHGYLETLIVKENLDEKKQKEYIQIALNGTEKLKKLINSLFEYSKLEAIQQAPEKSPFFINELAYDVFHKYQLLCQEKNLQFIPVIRQNIPMVFADIAMIDRVLQNLIENAIKFTPPKGTITLKAQQVENQIEIEISDTGTGISEEELPYIFDRYRKGSNSNQEGGGLGLAIVKKMLSLNGSAITVKSKLGEGSSFTFGLPLH